MSASYAETTLSLEELEEETRRANDRRYAFYRMLRATDSLLWKLEDLNIEGVKTLPLEDVRRMRATLADLPMSVESAFIENESVQEVLNGVFDVQDRLLAHFVPGYEPQADDGEESGLEADPKRQEHILRRVRQFGKATFKNINDGFSGAEKDAVRAEVALMVSTGLLSVDRYRSANHRLLTRYVVAGETS